MANELDQYKKNLIKQKLGDNAISLRDMASNAGWNVGYDSKTNNVSITNPANNKVLNFKSGEGTDFGMGGLYDGQNYVKDRIKLGSYLQDDIPKQDNIVSGNSLYSPVKDATAPGINFTPRPIQSFTDYTKENPIMNQTKEQYLAEQQRLAQANSNLKYDAYADNLKTRVANIIAGLNTQIGGLGGKYNPMFANTEKQGYDAMNQVGSALLRRGMSGGGVAQGAYAQNQFMTQQALKDIAIQKAQENADLSNQINTQQADLNNALAQIDRDKADYLTQQMTTASDKYDTNYMNALNSAKDAWLGSQNLVTNQDKLALDALVANSGIQKDLSIANAGNATDLAKTQMGIASNEKISGNEIKSKEYMQGREIASNEKMTLEKLGFDYANLSSEEKRYYHKANQDLEMFKQEHEQKWNMFIKEIGLKENELAEVVRNHKAVEEQDRINSERNYTISLGQLENDRNKTNAMISQGNEELKMKREQFKNEFIDFGNGVRLSPTQMAVYDKFNNEIDGAIGMYIDEARKQPKSAQGDYMAKAGTQIIGMIRSNPLNSTKIGNTFSQAKLELVKDMFGIKTPANINSNKQQTNTPYGNVTIDYNPYPKKEETKKWFKSPLDKILGGN